MMKYVGLTRRLFAYALDGFLYFSLIGLIHVFYNSPLRFFTEHDLPDTIFPVYLFLAFLYLTDQILLPVLRGFTLTRWMCGYRIKRRDGENPTFGQALLRFFSIMVFELFSIGIITFIITIFRKDKAAVHDILSRTYAVLPERGSSLKHVRIGITVTLISMGLLIFLNALTYSIHDIFVRPVKQKALSGGLPLNPPKRPNAHQLSERAVILKGVSLFNTRNTEKAHICLSGSEGGLDEYALSIGNEEFKVVHDRSPLDNPPFYSYEPSTWDRALSFILKSDPFLEPPYRIAEKTLHNDDVDFPVFAPLNNIARLSSSIIWAVAMPVHQSEHAISGDTSFAIIVSTRNEKFSLEGIKVFRAEEMEFYDIFFD